MAVVPGDELLDNQRIPIARRVDGGEDGIELPFAVGDENLFLVGETAVPIGDAVGGLDHDGKIKGRTVSLPVPGGAGVGLGKQKAVFGADGIESLLGAQPLEQTCVADREAVIRPQRVLIAGQEPGVIVPTGNQQQGDG